MPFSHERWIANKARRERILISMRITPTPLIALHMTFGIFVILNIFLKLLDEVYSY